MPRPGLAPPGTAGDAAESRPAEPLDAPASPAPLAEPPPAPPTGRGRRFRRPRLLGAFDRSPAFRRFWFGAVAATLGQWMQQIALGWLALTLTDSPGFVGLVGFMAGLPFLVVSLPGGMLVDRLDRRHLMLRCQAAAMALAIVVAAVVVAGWAQPWHLLLAAFLNGSLQALLAPAQQSLVPALVPRADLTNALGLMSAGQNMTRIAGPSVAGLAISWFGVGPAFLLQAVAIAAAFLLVRGVAVPARVPPSGGRGIFDGVRLVASRPDLRGLFLLAAVPTFFIFPYVQFLSVFARDILSIGAGGLGMLLAASGSGAVIGSLLTASRRQTAGAGRVIIRLTVLYGWVILLIALSRTVWLTLPLLVLAGLLGSSFMSTNNVVLQHRITDDVRGRVMGAYLLTFGLMPLGAMPMGLVADRYGAPTAVAAGAALSSTIAILVAIRSPALRQL